MIYSTTIQLEFHMKYKYNIFFFAISQIWSSASRRTRIRQDMHRYYIKSSLYEVVEIEIGHLLQWQSTLNREKITPDFQIEGNLTFSSQTGAYIHDPNENSTMYKNRNPWAIQLKLLFHLSTWRVLYLLWAGGKKSGGFNSMRVTKDKDILWYKVVRRSRLRGIISLRTHERRELTIQ